LTAEEWVAFEDAELAQGAAAQAGAKAAGAVAYAIADRLNRF
jgi:hypothetical protein